MKLKIKLHYSVDPILISEIVGIPYIGEQK